MALVDYSDSESEGETKVEAPKQNAAAKPAFQKAAGKIAVSLPSLKAEPGQKEDESTNAPPAKRARIGGTFSGINSFLPAPKKTAANALKPGINLKTSGEAAFSRNPPPQAPVEEEKPAQVGHEQAVESLSQKADPVEEPKLVGKNTRFLPLSVSGKKKKKPISKPPPVTERNNSADNGKHSDMAKAAATKVAKEQDPEPVPKPKRSLFSVNPEEKTLSVSQSTGDYEPLMVDEGRGYLPEEVHQPATSQSSDVRSSNPNSLEAVAADMDLTPAQRRQLFGRRGDKDVNVAHFNLDSEYAANEQMRQAGEVIEHRAVKAVAPGKHSLQQLVNNARTQQEALEDKWGEGRRARGEGGSKYGWSG